MKSWFSRVFTQLGTDTGEIFSTDEFVQGPHEIEF